MNLKSKNTWYALIIAVFLLSCCTWGFVPPVVRKLGERDYLEESWKSMNHVKDSINRHVEEKKVMPNNLGELLPYVSDSKVKEKLEKGEIEVVWGAEIYAKREIDAKTWTESPIVAWYAKPGPMKSLRVLRQDGYVDNISEGNLRSAPKAKTVQAKN